MDNQTKQCQNCKQNFVIEPEDFEFYEKIKVPPPTFCPECRTQRRMMFRNERTLYKRKCTALGHVEDLLTMYSLGSNIKIVDQKYWWSDEWDAIEYGKDYDFSKPFFQQYKELRDNFPLQALSNTNTVNSDFCNVNDKSKDCYLISASYDNESVMYANRVTANKDSADLYVVQKSDLCYEDVSCKENYKVLFSLNSYNCSDSYFLYDCRNCTNCFGCTNLRNKQYHIFNQPYSKEEYNKKLEEFNLGSYKNILNFRNTFRELYIKGIHKYANLLKSFNVLGDNISNAQNCHYCFDITDGAENVKYSNWGGINLKDSYDGGPGIGVNSDLLCEVFDTGIQASRIFATNVVYGSHDVSYAFFCHNSSNLFGCIGLRNKQYCILNKQYTKEEYNKLLPQIIDHMNNMPYISRAQISSDDTQINSDNISENLRNNPRKSEIVYKYGEFFPPELSPFAYNETIAQEYFPLTKEQAIEQGYNWKDPEERNIQITIQAKDLLDHIKDVDDSILQQVIECENNSDAQKGRSPDQDASGCTTAYKIIKSELDFYRKMNLPLPRLCPNCRHYQRIKQRNPLKLWHRKCMCNGSTSSPNNNSTIHQYNNTVIHTHGNEPCPNEFETTYSPDRPEIVYCEQCYQQEVA